MISYEAYEAVNTLANKLVTNNRVIKPIPNTPLDVLVRATPNEYARFAKGEETNSPDTEGASPVESYGGGGQQLNYYDVEAEHDVHMDEVTREVANALRGHIAYARGVVAPTVEEMVQLVTDKVTREPSRLTEFNIVIAKLPTILRNPSFLALVDKHGDVPYQDDLSYFTYPKKTDEELLEIIKTGMISIDKEIIDNIPELGIITPRAVFDHFFCGEKQYLEYTRSDEAGVFLYAFLMALGLYDTPYENSGMSLVEFNERMVVLRNQAAFRIKRAVDRYDAELKRETLVRENRGTTIVVNGEIYSKWIESGANNSVLFSNTFRERPLFTLPDVTEHYDELLKSWNQFSAAAKLADSQRYYNNARLSLIDSFKEIIKRKKEEKTNEITSGVDYWSRNTTKGIDYINNLDKREYDHGLYDVVLRLLCSTIYSHTDAQEILTEIERVKKQNPDITIEEAASASLVSYVCSWVSAQMRVESI